jgi:hypothetical protein
MNTVAKLLCCAALLGSCREEKSATSLTIDFTFNGLVIRRLPDEGKGVLGIEPYRLEYAWDAEKLEIRDNRDGTFTITGPHTDNFSVTQNKQIIFEDDGSLKIITINF